MNVRENVKASGLLVVNPVPRSRAFPYLAPESLAAELACRACNLSGWLRADCYHAEHCSAIVFGNFNF